MADRSFEEQVRKELEALRLTPDDMVWQNVEAELHKDKKRRWLIWLFALLVTAGSAGLYYQFNNDADNNKTDKKVTATTQPSIREGSQPAINDISKSAPADAAENNKTNTEATGKKADTFKEQVQHPASPVGKSISARTNEAAKNRVISGKQAVTPGARSSTADQTQTSKTTAALNLPGNTAEKPAVKNDPVLTVITPEATGGKKNNTSVAEMSATAKNDQQKTADSQPVPENLQKTDSVQPTSSAAVTVEIKKSKQPWQFFVSAEMGRSGEITSLRSAARVFDAGRQNIGGGAFFAPGNSIGNSSAILYKTPSRSDGPAFVLMVQAVKPIGKKSSIGISSGYAYYSSLIGIGERVDSATTLVKSDHDYYYLSTDSATYINRYHYLSLNVDYYLGIGLGKAASLRWRIGLGTGLLLSSNALHFSDQNGILYKNASLTPRIQWNISTGLDIGLGKKQGFFIGPQFTYFINRTSGEASTGRHLFIAGVRGSIAIPKKKK